MTNGILVIYTLCMAKIIISLPDSLLAKIDSFCKINSYNRSEFLRFAVRGIINEPKKDVQKNNTEAPKEKEA